MSGRPEPGLDAFTVTLVTQTQRRRRATAGNALDRVRALARDPHLYELAAVVTVGNQRDHSIGGRPLPYPDWCLLLFGGRIRVFGSASAAARALQDPAAWQEVRCAAAGVLGQGALTAVPATRPTRDHWSYFCKRRVTDAVLEALTTKQRDLAVRRAREVGLLDPDDAKSPGKYRREHVVGLDGKVFSSPLRTLDTERVDKTTGQLRPVRQDTARQRYGEGGVDNLVWGTKFAIASVRSRLANHRVILGVVHFDATTTGGEGRVFTDLALDLATRAAGIHAFTADGAWRGTHLNRIQTATGCGVIAPPRRRTGKRGGIVVDGVGHAAQPLPWSRRRLAREAACGGHQIWAAAGTLFEQIINADGETEYRELTRHQTKRDTTRHKDGTVRHQFYARYSLPCPAVPTTTGGSRCSTSPRTPRPSSTAPSTSASPPLPASITDVSTGCDKTPKASMPSSSWPSTASACPPGASTNQTTVILLAAVVWYDEAHQAEHPDLP